ncbi:MAG: fatty-acid oxidation protein subunit alpha [Chthoniobacteraceae bacterium]|nr:fatty-acid oxidation protein subunit alpha [Chthoniobacteraceae bacterium]
MNNIRRDITEDGICVLTFDRPGSSANIFDRATLQELGAHIDQIGTARGLVVTSAKDSIFVAGADLHSIKTMSPADLGDFIRLGQDVFNKIAALRIPSVAAIHGAAVGGGFEIGLACDYRIATPDRATKLGLPETQLGIIPAWGGSTRLPRLIGVPKALEMILGGKTVGARHALKLGMINEVVSREYLLSAAFEWIGKGKHRNRLSHSAPVNAVLDKLVAPKARADVMKRTQGHYPAVLKALEVVIKGASDWRESESLARERAAVSELIGLDSTRNLLRLFFLQERAKKLRFTPRPISEIPALEGAAPAVLPGDEIGRAAVIGAGVMGSGIAQWLSARGVRTIVRDIDATRVGAGMANISKLYADSVKHRVFTSNEARAGFERVYPAPGEVSLRQSGLVIEAAVEKMAIKKTIFQRLDELTDEQAILATNTSALSITELASATRHPERVIGIHFFNPVHKMQLVEVVRGRQTAPAVIQQTLRFVQKIGKLPVLVKDSPGFLVNRILLPYMLEAGVLFEAGASIEEIDAAMVAFGMPMGPLRLIDEVGVDIAEDVAATLSMAFPERMRVPQVLSKLIAAGWLGKKSGKGFYLHEKGSKSEPRVNPEVEVFRSGKARFTPEELQRRMVLLMVNESARCLEEEIVEEPADIDFAMVMGTGFAPFRGGPLRYADQLGAPQVASQLSLLAEKIGPYFEPCALLKAINRRPFYED